MNIIFTKLQLEMLNRDLNDFDFSFNSDYYRELSEYYNTKRIINKKIKILKNDGLTLEKIQKEASDWYSIDEEMTRDEAIEDYVYSMLHDVINDDSLQFEKRIYKII